MRAAGTRWLELFHYRREPRDREAGLGHDVPPMHAPLWTSRLTLEIEDLRIEHLALIDNEDAIREGVTGRVGPNDRWLYGVEGAVPFRHMQPRDAFRELWKSINTAAPRRWLDNPLVMVISFRAQQVNISALPWCPRATASRLTPAAARALQNPSGHGAQSSPVFDLLYELGLILPGYQWTDRAALVRRQLELTGRH